MADCRRGDAVHRAGALLAYLAPRIEAAEVEPLALGVAALIAELNPVGEASAIFGVSAFADDMAKTNSTTILAQHAMKNVRSL